MTPRCTNRVAWVGLDMSSRCRRPDGHPAEHRDHQWAWDDNGIRVDGTDHRRHASGVIDHPSRLTVEQVAEIRASQQAGQRTIDIARRMLLPYTTVYSVVTGQTYRTGDRPSGGSVMSAEPCRGCKEYGTPCPACDARAEDRKERRREGEPVSFTAAFDGPCSDCGGNVAGHPCTYRDGEIVHVTCPRIEVAGAGWLAANNDCVPETESMADNSVDLIVTSIPFSNHYEYTPSYNDFGHTDDNAHFWAQMDYLTPQLLRVLAPGRIYACHVKDRILFGSVTGAGVPTVSPFHAEAIFHARKHGFDYLGMRTIVTDVVRENNQTYRLGWSEMAKDATKMGSGSPEYVLLFHKPQSDRARGYADTPVTKDKADYTRSRWQVDAHAFWRSSGNRHLTPDELAALPPEQMSRLFTEQTLRQVYDHESHVRIGESLDGRGALPSTFMALAPGSWHPDVWSDVNRMLTLNTEQSRRAQAMHVCPLQFDIVDRLIRLYSNPGELIYDPFGGLMTVPVRALKLGRRGRGVELNTGYYLDGVKYLQATEREVSMPSLFDLDAPESVPA